MKNAKYLSMKNKKLVVHILFTGWAGELRSSILNNGLLDDKSFYYNILDWKTSIDGELNDITVEIDSFGLLDELVHSSLFTLFQQNITNVNITVEEVA